MNIQEQFPIGYSRFATKRPEMRGDDFAGEDNAALDETGAADSRAGCQLYVDRWSAL